MDDKLEAESFLEAFLHCFRYKEKNEILISYHESLF